MAHKAPIEQVSEPAKKTEVNPVLLYHKNVVEQIKAKTAQQNTQAEQVAKAPKPEPTPDPALRWSMVSKNGKAEWQVIPDTYQTDFTTISTHDEEVAAPSLLNVLGYKIDLKAKIDHYTDNYIKSYALSRSHNLIVAKFAELKVAFLGYLLSILGVSSEEIQKLQKKAISNSIRENKLLFEENEFNGELINIIGGSRKQVRSQMRVVGEIRKQLVLQAKRLGMKDYYTQENILDTQTRQCQRILNKFQEEMMHLEYQLAYFCQN
jgi:hypothetical protein